MSPCHPDKDIQGPLQLVKQEKLLAQFGGNFANSLDDFLCDFLLIFITKALFVLTITSCITVHFHLRSRGRPLMQSCQNKESSFRRYRNDILIKVSRKIKISSPA